MGRILIAEDEEGVSSVLKIILTAKGHEVTVSPDGRHALETLQNGEGFDLLVTDIMMPEMSGCELIKSMQEQQGLADMPIIILSGYMGAVEMADLFGSGVKVCIPKPINMKDLERHINDYCPVPDLNPTFPILH